MERVLAGSCGGVTQGSGLLLMCNVFLVRWGRREAGGSSSAGAASIREVCV